MKDWVIRAIRRPRSDKGFTLVELLVTTTIIGVLAAVVTVGVSGASSTAQTKANIQLINGIQGGLDTYAAQNSLATGVPVTGNASLDTTNYFSTTGVPGAVSVSTSDQVIDFTSSTNSFSQNFRLNNSSTNFKCVVTSNSTFSLKACRN